MYENDFKWLESEERFCSILVNNIAKVNQSTGDYMSVLKKISPEKNADACVADIQCSIQCISVIQHFTPIAQPAAGLTPEANKRKHDRNGVSQNCSKNNRSFHAICRLQWQCACGWVLPGRELEWRQWLVYHLSPVEPERPYAQAEGGWATEPWSCSQLLGPNCRAIWRWITCVFWEKLWTPIAWFSGMLTRIDILSWILLLQDCNLPFFHEVTLYTLSLPSTLKMWWLKYYKHFSTTQ